MTFDDVTPILRHRGSDVNLIARLNDVIDGTPYWNVSTGGGGQGVGGPGRISLYELIGLGANTTADTYDVRNLQLVKMRSPFHIATVCSAYLAVFVLSLFANCLVCHVIRANRRLHTVTNIFIANLAVSDIFITVVNIPFNVVRHIKPDWTFGHFLCGLVNFALTVFVYVSTLTMAAIAVDRYVVILHPLRPRMSVAVGLAVVVVTWFVASVMSLPFAIFAQVRDVELLLYSAARCSVVYPAPSDVIERYVTLTTFVGQYALPMLVTSLAYGRIATRLWRRGRDIGGFGSGVLQERHRAGQQRVRRRSIALLATVVVVFTVSWLPLNLYHILTDFHPDTARFHYSSTAYLAVHWLAVSSVCCNPFAYCWLNESFRASLRMRCVRRRPAAGSRQLSYRPPRRYVTSDDHVITAEAPVDGTSPAAMVRYNRVGYCGRQQRRIEVRGDDYYCVWRATCDPAAPHSRPTTTTSAAAAGRGAGCRPHTTSCSPVGCYYYSSSPSAPLISSNGRVNYTSSQHLHAGGCGEGHGLDSSSCAGRCLAPADGSMSSDQFLRPRRSLPDIAAASLGVGGVSTERTSY